MQLKTELRPFYRARRDAFLGAQRDSAQNTIIATLARVLARGKYRRVALYMAVRGEANLDELLRVLALQKIVFAAPAGLHLPPSFRVVTTENIKRNERGARLPSPDAELVQPHSFDAILVPAIAFDESGNRLGQGAGWYDRFLAQAPNARKIGVAFECQMAPQLPRESHDVGMDFVVTQNRCIDMKSASR